MRQPTPAVEQDPHSSVVTPPCGPPRWRRCSVPSADIVPLCVCRRDVPLRRRIADPSPTRSPGSSVRSLRCRSRTRSCDPALWSSSTSSCRAVCRYHRRCSASVRSCRVGPPSWLCSLRSHRWSARTSPHAPCSCSPFPSPSPARPASHDHNPSPAASVRGSSTDSSLSAHPDVRRAPRSGRGHCTAAVDDRRAAASRRCSRPCSARRRPVRCTRHLRRTPRAAGTHGGHGRRSPPAVTPAARDRRDRSNSLGTPRGGRRTRWSERARCRSPVRAGGDRSPGGVATDRRPRILVGRGADRCSGSPRSGDLWCRTAHARALRGEQAGPELEHPWRSARRNRHRRCPGQRRAGPRRAERSGDCGFGPRATPREPTAPPSRTGVDRSGVGHGGGPDRA